MVKKKLAYVVAGVPALLLAATLHTPLQAQDGSPAETVSSAKVCGAIDDTAKRLTCYDKLFRAKTVVAEKKPDAKKLQAALKEAEARAKAAEARLAELERKQQELAKQQAKAAQTPEQAFGKSERKAEDIDELEATIEEVATLKNNQAIIFLDNGQIWRSIESAKRFYLKAGKTVRIKKGSLGSYRLFVGKSKKALRVKRKR
ncbi:hypothetical protein KFE96_07340 [Kordiimonas sp. SCSIO 12603]|uniref:hypothetical protein n=1 Tax=Kordiimonas sp. SCSIO 12603 TaxID=2829596 RepID=UPI0021072F85|nr:hypothetical protein [Kordiimonas sp. SCSIO 12603]UTW60115.1 hypothetical protein KFE96_07340 [Kordiimonas sp. SCSIO 12603]